MAATTAQPQKSPLLDFVGTVKIPAAAKFIIQEKFVLNYGKKAKPGVRIAYLSDNFKQWFLDKIEEATPEAVLRYAKLTRAALDDEIRAEIGAEFEQTTLAQIFALMALQPDGREGALLTNWWATIFYVPDVKGVLRVVLVYWHADDGGWSVHAYSVGLPSGWHVGHRAFSRNSSETMAA